MLFGEHAVVYNRPCAVTAVDQRMQATVEGAEEKVFSLDAPEVQITGYQKPMSELGKGEIPKGAKFVEVAVKNFIEKFPSSSGIKITTSSDFSSQFGFGSSSASTVCVLKALSEISGKKLDNKQLFDLAFKTILDVQGKGSGFDVAAAIWGGTLYFVTGGKVIEPLKINGMPLVIGYTGVKADTVTLMKEVAGKMSSQPERVDRIYDAIAKLVEEAKNKMIEGDWERVGGLMDFNQEYLRDLGVSSEKLEALISAAKGAGAWGAKLSGAGGGDCMIALVDEKKRKIVEDAITKAGGQVIHITPAAEGVRLETTDAQDEIFIVVDRDDNVLGYKTRYECHHNKLFIHRSVGVLIFDDKGRILLQKRSQTKDIGAGLWGISSAGHVTKGQEYEESAHRELKEELGIDASLTLISKHIEESIEETEMSVLYKTRSNGPFRPNAEEVDRVEFFDPRKLKFDVSTKRIQLTSWSYSALRIAGIDL